jgi:hypothetical protein
MDKKYEIILDRACTMSSEDISAHRGIVSVATPPHMSHWLPLMLRARLWPSFSPRLPPKHCVCLLVCSLSQTQATLAAQGETLVKLAAAQEALRKQVSEWGWEWLTFVVLFLTLLGLTPVQQGQLACLCLMSEGHAGLEYSSCG